MSFNEKLQYLRKNSKYSQEKLADLLDVTRQSVSKWESGQTYPEMDKLLAICKIFNCTLEELTNDEIKEFGLEKKNNFNNVIDSILDFITKSYDMLTNMSFKEIFRCAITMFTVFIFIVIALIPLNIFKSSIGQILYSNNIFINRVLSLGGVLLNTIYFLLSSLFFIYVFKIGFLDKYKYITKTSNFENEDDKNILEVINTNEIKKLPKRDNNYAFFKLVGKVTMFFIKSLLVIFSFPIFVFLLSLFAFLIIDIYILIKGVLFLSILILIIFAIVLTILVLEFIANILFEKKHSYKRMLITLFVGISGLGIGFGTFFLEIHNIKYLDYLPKNIEKSIKSFEYEFDKNIMLENFGEINYVVDDNLKDKIVINIEYYKDFNNIDVNIVDNYYYLENYELTDTYLNYVNIILDGLRSKTFYNWELLNDNTVKITTSAKNIDKLKNNLSEKEQKELEIKELEKYYDEKINEIYNDSSKLEDKILELEESNYVLEQEKEDLQIKLEEYKDKVKSIIE